MTKNNNSKPKETLGATLNTPRKLRLHKEKMLNFLGGNPTVPITCHFMPTLVCDQSCFFCSYGSAKKKQSGIYMEREDALRYIRELHESGVNALIFTGGGDPLCYPHLAELMKECDKLNMPFSLNTNGYRFTDKLIKEIINKNPTYIRVSINGSPKTQKFMTGVDNFDTVRENLKKVLIKRWEEGKLGINVSVATVVTIVNYDDLKALSEEIMKLEEQVIAICQTSQATSNFDWHIRPAYNYATSKFDNTADDIIKYLQSRNQADVHDFRDYLYKNEQTPQKMLDIAVDTIEEIKVSLKNGGANVRVSYPINRFNALNATHENGQPLAKSYTKCHGQHFYAALWMDGRLYSCVEKAGLDDREIGNMSKQSAKEIFTSAKRAEKIKEIDGRITCDCPATCCAYHDTNMYLDRLIKNPHEYQGANCPDDCIHSSSSNNEKPLSCTECKKLSNFI